MRKVAGDCCIGERVRNEERLGLREDGEALGISEEWKQVVRVIMHSVRTELDVIGIILIPTQAEKSLLMHDIYFILIICSATKP